MGSWRDRAGFPRRYGKPDRPLFSLADAWRASQEAPPELGSLARILAGRPLVPPAPPVITDRWFKDQTLRIDGYTFERCRFDRCKLVTEMATSTLRGCVMGQDCELYFVGPALKIARLLMHMLRMKGRLTALAGEEALFAPLSPDGTFTIE